MVEDSHIRYLTMASKSIKTKYNNKLSSGVDPVTQGPPNVLALIQDAVTLDSNPNMKQAVEITLKIVQKVQVCISESCDYSSTNWFS